MYLRSFVNPNGDFEYINPDHVVAVRAAGSDRPNTVIVTLNGEFAVTEDVDAVATLLCGW